MVALLLSQIADQQYVTTISQVSIVAQQCVTTLGYQFPLQHINDLWSYCFPTCQERYLRTHKLFLAHIRPRRASKRQDVCVGNVFEKKLIITVMIIIITFVIVLLCFQANICSYKEITKRRPVSLSYFYAIIRTCKIKCNTRSFK